jgi:hypothetical protein
MKYSTLNKVSLTTLALVGALAISARADPSAANAQHFQIPFHVLAPDSTYMIDDGTSEFPIGVRGGGDLIALNEFAVIPGSETITSVSIAWGTGERLDGLPYTVAVWSDPNGDGNPTDAVLLTTSSGVVSMEGTNTFIITLVTPTTITTPNFFVGFLIPNTTRQQFPAAFDQTDPTFSNRSYYADSASGTGNIENLNDNDTPVAPIESFGSPFIGNWLIRADGGGALELTNAVSKKAGFEIALPGVECRLGGANNNYTIIFTFNNTLASVGSTETACGAVSSSMIGKDAHQFIVNLTGVNCNEQETTIALTNVTDTLGNNLPSASTTMGLLIGDVNGDGTVDTADVHQTATNVGQFLTEDNFRDDVNVDGLISRTDVNLVKSHVGDSLP